jgi:hypothetical protein
MKRDDDFRVRPGRIRSKRAQRAQAFIAQALAAAEKAGRRVSRRGRLSSPRASTFGRGRSASVRAKRLLTSRSRGAVVKARVVQPNRSPMCARYQAGGFRPGRNESDIAVGRHGKLTPVPDVA